MGQSSSQFYETDRSSFSIRSIDFNQEHPSKPFKQLLRLYHDQQEQISTSTQEPIISFIRDPDGNQHQSITSIHQSSLLSIPIPSTPSSLNLNFQLQINPSSHSSSSIAFIITDSSDSLSKLLQSTSTLPPHSNSNSNLILLPNQSNQPISFNWTFSPPPNSQRTSGYRTLISFVAFDQHSNQSQILSSFSVFFQTSTTTIEPFTIRHSAFTDFVESSLLTTPIQHQPNQFQDQPNHSQDQPNHSQKQPNHSQKQPNHSQKQPHHSQDQPNHSHTPSVTFASSNNLLSTHISQISKSSTSPNLNSSAFPSSTPTEPFTLPTPDLAFEDGPLFRAKLVGLERRSANLKRGLKHIIKLLEQYHETLTSLVECDRKLEEAFAQLDDISPAAYRPLKDSYLQNARHLFHGLHSEQLDKLQNTALQPLRKVFNRLKEADHHKKAFDHESKSFYEYITKYLAIRTGSAPDSISKEARAAERFDQMKTKFAFARIDYHHTLYELAIFQETEVLQILTDYQINQHELHCLGTDLAQRLAPLGTSLHQLKSDLLANRIEIDNQKDSLEAHRRWWATKLGVMSQQTPFPDIVSNSSYQSFSLIDGARLSIDQMISPPPNSRPSNASQTPIMKSATTSNIASMAHPLSPTSLHTPSQPRSYDLAERLKGFAHTLAGITFQRDSSGLDHSTLNPEPLSPIQGSSTGSSTALFQISTQTRQPRASLPGSPLRSPNPCRESPSLRSSSVDLPSRDKILNRDQLGMSHPLPGSSSLNVPSPILGNTSTISFATFPLPENEIQPDSQIEELETIPTPSQSRKKEGYLYSSTKLLSVQQLSTSNINSIDTSSSKSWKKLWCVLSLGQLSEFDSNWVENSNLQINRPPINLRFATVREIKNPERRFCFEVITHQTKRTYQATMDSEMKDWIRAISASIESLLNGTSSIRNFDFSKLQNQSNECLRSLIEETNQTNQPSSISRDSIGSHEYERPNQRMNSNELIRVQSYQPVGFGRGLATKLIRKTSKLQSSNSNSNLISSNGLQKNRFTSSSKRPKSGLSHAGISSSSSTSKLPLSKNHEGSHSNSMSCMTLDENQSERIPSNLNRSNHSNHSDQPTSDLSHSIPNSTSTTTTMLTHEMKTKEETERNQLMFLKNLEKLNSLSQLEANSKCIECGKKPARWASYSLGIFLCIRCSGFHRGLGTHLSKVRSLDLDDWSDEQIKNMELIGNEKAKLVWEARLPVGFKVTDQNVGDFIKEKYGFEKYKMLPKVEEIKDEMELKEIISIGIGSGSYVFEERLVEK